MRRMSHLLSAFSFQLSAFPLLAQVDEALKTLDHAAQMDMKWWFLGLLGTGLAAIWMVARYFTIRHDALSTRLDKVQDDRTSELKENNGRLVKVIEDSNQIIKAFTEMLGTVKHL